MLRKMKIWQKLVLIAVFMGAPIPIVTYLLYAEKSNDKEFAQKEVYGVHYIRLTAPLLRDIQKHRVLNSIYARGDQSALEEMNKQKQLIDQDIRVIEELEQQPLSKSFLSKLFGGEATYGATLRSAEQLRIIKDKWETIKRQSPSFTPAQSFEAHTALCQNIIDLTAHVGDTSNLILDPDLDTYYLMDAVVINIPKAMENIGAMKTMTVSIAAANSKTLDEEKVLSLLSGRATENISNLKTGVQKVVAYNPSIQQEIAPPMEKAAASAELFLSTTDKTIIRVDKVEMLAGTKDTLSSPESNGDDFFKYNTVALNQLENLLHLRISGIWWSQMFVFTMLLGGLLVTTLLVLFIVRSITQPLNNALSVAKGLAKGDLRAKIETDATDETGQLLLAMNEMIAYLNEMADVSDKIAGGHLKVDVRTRSAEDRFGNSFKNMLDNTLKLVQSQDERNEMQNSIMKLLNEVADVASGDLTAQAEVTPDMTGAIADAFNYMILELRNVINKVKETTLQVSSSAAEIQATTEHLAEGSEMQSKQINDTSMAIEEMAASIHQVSENAAISASVADKSLVTARQGTDAVQNNIQAMSRIREQVQETSKRIKRLGERSQEIGEIVKLIDDIADRTSMLALNASIQAAMAGEAGRGFAVVAEEVERLADRSTNATKQITALTKSIQSETNEVVMAMEDTTREVVEGSTLANEAGKALSEIQSVSQQLAELIQSISQASKQQARGSEALAKSMSGISEVTNQVASGTKQAAVSVRSMVVLADELRGSVVTFKLPESNGNGNGHAYN